MDFDLNRFFTIIIKPVRSSEYSISWRKPSAEESLPKSRELLGLNEQVKLSDTDIKILTVCAEKPHSTSEILEELGYKLKSGSYKKSLKKLKDLGLLLQTIPEKPTSPDQRYRTKEDIVKIIKNQ